MRKLANLLSGLILVLVFLAAITFSYFNTTPVSLEFGNLVLAARPVAVWIIAAFVIGGGLGLLLGLGLFRSLRHGAELRRTRKELAAAKQELNKLRAMSLRDLD